MFKLIPGIFVLLLGAVINVNSLQCYVCENCSEVTAEQLMTCGAETTTQAPTTVSPGTGTTPTPPTSASTGSTGPSSESPPTSVPTVSPSAVPSTASPTTESTTTSPTTIPSTASPTTESTTTSPTTVSSTASPTTESTTVPPIAIPSTEPSVAPEKNLPYEVNRVKRKAVTIQERAIEYVCITVTLEDTNTVYRGCAVDNDKVCDTSEVSSIVNVTCTSCKSDKCNSAASIQVSAILIIAAAILKLI